MFLPLLKGTLATRLVAGRRFVQLAFDMANYLEQVKQVKVANQPATLTDLTPNVQTWLAAGQWASAFSLGRVCERTRFPNSLRALREHTDQGLVIGADTETGKTKAFYLPALAS